jgi:hypothetical protein
VKHPAETAPGVEAGRWAEWVAIVVLVAMAATLAWVNVSLRRRTRPPEAPAFDLKNPMLDARPRECVEIFQQGAAREAPCISVREDGLVLRPTRGPESAGEFGGLRRALPYLAARVRSPAAGGTCAAGPAGAEQTVVYPLAHFGVPMERRVRLDTIRPQWVDEAERQRLVYQVVLEDAGGASWELFVSPDALVTGLVQVRLHDSKAGSRAQVLRYLDVGECP